MKITALDYKRLRIQLYEPFRVAFGDIDTCENVLVRITTDAGITGYGEAAPFAFVTGETAQSVEAVLDLLRPGLIGRDPLAVAELCALMDSFVYGNGSAKCAVDLALHDIWGKAEGKPVWQLLGGQNGDVWGDMTIGIDEPARMAQKAAYYAGEKGYRILKVKAGRALADDAAALAGIRQAVGPDVRLRVDANQGYDVDTALAALAAFKELGVEAVEQCLPWWDFEGAAYLNANVRGIQLMLDESIHDAHDAARAVKEKAADILNIKLMKCGGLYGGVRIAKTAAAGGLTCMMGCMLETPLSITAGLSLVAADDAVTDADCDSFLYYDNAQVPVRGGFTVEGDIFKLSAAPGLGIEVDF